MSVVTRLILVALTLVATNGCCNLTQRQLPLPESVAESAKGVLQMEHLDEDETTDTSFSVYVKFYEWTTYPCLIQEIHLPSGNKLVEVFKTPNGRQLSCYRDHHSGSWTTKPGKQVRHMFLYPGEVDGVDWTIGGFAQLPQNKDGSVVTDISDTFNVAYQWKGKRNPDTGKFEYKKEHGVNHETRGKVVKERRDLGFWWTIIFDDGKVEVIIPGRHQFEPEKILMHPADND